MPQPWKMTFHEYFACWLGRQSDVIQERWKEAVRTNTKTIGRLMVEQQLIEEHKAGVIVALQRGDPVPANVLADYPDLLAQTPPMPK